MSFSISFTSAPDQYLDDDPTIPSAIGRIVAGTLDEEFASSLYEWDKAAYKSQWLESLRRVVGGADRAVLVTWYVSPIKSSDLQWWALYRGNSGPVHIQSHMPCYRNLDRTFPVSDANSFLDDRIEVDEDGRIWPAWEDIVLPSRNQFPSSRGGTVNGMV